MRFIQTIRFLLIPALLLAQTSFAQIGINLKPLITGQVPLPLNTDENVPVTIQINNLIIIDLNDLDHSNFIIKLYEGNNYTFQGTTVTPDKDFKGTLTVPLTVNDGKDESNKFDFKIRVNEVENVRPVITGQLALSTTKNQNITIELNDLTVVDPDNKYPDDFTLKVSSGQNYSVKDNTITPNAGFVGTLNVPVTVHDGEDESEKYTVRITVTDKPNVVPVITGQEALSVNEDQSITLALVNLKVTDSDNEYPQGFTLKIYDGNNYTFTGNKITPVANYSGSLSVIVSVNDGKDESATYPLQIAVKPVNDAPLITGQSALTTFINTPITINFLDLSVTDPDNKYSDGFSLKISPGFTYTVAGNVITPAPNFSGTIRANITVNDGSANSNIFELQIKVIASPNIAPVITGQKPNPIVTTTGSSFPIDLSQLLVTDPDNDYPTDFTLTVKQGNNYTVTGTTVTPAPNFTGTLPVRVLVNDGKVNSNVYNLQVSVIPITARPQIIGQQSLIINEDESITLRLTDLVVSDADDVYPNGFTLQVLTDPEKKYQADKLIVTPAKDLNGFLSVKVTVTDNDGNQSEPFNLAILINPVNDAPVIIQLETEAISYEPGTEPAPISATIDVLDVDNDHLSFAEISMGTENYSKGSDELLFTNTANIRGIFDVDAGKLSLVGYATLSEYKEALRSVTYHYQLPDEEGGAGTTILPGDKSLLITVHDGQQQSEYKVRGIVMETEVL
ncbi:MAG: hypothetical protein C0490_06750, partial [Marivirga sp.]|nr:hypothetical protein [Marivirga sp.]